MRERSPVERIPVAGPWITQKEIDYVTDAVSNAWYENATMYHDRFEAGFARYVGRQYAIALPSCTSAIHLALCALGVGASDEVIVPDLTWIASAAPIHYVGATPVFADVDPQSWCLSAESFQRCITPKTKAVIVVDLYGNMPDMSAILAIAADHGIAVIEDAAQAIGSEYHGQKAGSFGDVSVFSFHGSKTLTTGEGGMLLTNRPDIYERCLTLRDHGRSPQGRLFWNTEIGYKYKMSSMQAALGLAQLERVDELIQRKREIFSRYQMALQELPGITLNQEADGILNTYWMVSIILDPSFNLPKEKLMAALHPLNIDTRPVFYPLSSLPAYESVVASKPYAQKNPVAYHLGHYGINLPSGFNVSNSDIAYISACLYKVVS